ncbi:hypothetical protein WICPIJ_007386 [Wickerhamomyces pijperi]|uniref:Uncharacterized protein n=1 Tax=Wickerhamomyces pijperi TaxID=599730 RepID=A0A9P8Q1W5_WICPI|nr:hypothetical protein WICPIJ_007386 [Wickerhamomyces pijperi]
MEQINQYASQLESVPGYDEAIDWINDKLGAKYQTKDPYFVVDSKGKKHRRKLPESSPKELQKAWKKVQKKGWKNDYNFLGWFPVNLGFGLCPLLLLCPVIGQFIMYSMSLRLISVITKQIKVPDSVLAKMYANVTFDLLISLPPILGSLFTWMHACSTRNLVLIHNFIVQSELEALNVQNEQRDIYEGHTFGH